MLWMKCLFILQLIIFFFQQKIPGKKTPYLSRGGCTRTEEKRNFKKLFLSLSPSGVF